MLKIYEFQQFYRVRGISNILYNSNDINTFIRAVFDTYTEIREYNITYNYDGIDYITYFDNDYPANLRDISSPPLVIFYRGNKSVFNMKMAAIIGSRKMTGYGEGVAREITKLLVNKGYVIVSGLAYGIDEVAHRVTMEMDGRTVGVLPSGIMFKGTDRICKLGDEICKKGILVSEFLPDVHPARWTFPVRNRIISGLSYMVFIIEARDRSGSMITAELAFKQNRRLFVVPGRIWDKNSSGCLRLIAENKAEPVISIEWLNSIVEDVNIKKPVTDPLDLTWDEDVIFNIIRDNNGNVHYDKVLRLSPFDSAKTALLLIQLEMKGLIGKIRGNYYTIY